MSSLGISAILSIIQAEEAASIYKVSHSLLLTTEEKDLHDFTVDYLRKTSALPSIDVVNKHFGVKYDEPSGLPEYYIDELYKRNVYTGIADKLPTIAKSVKKDPLGSLEQLRKLVEVLSRNDTRLPLRYGEDATVRREDYLARVGSKGVTYLSTGTKILDDYTYGFQRGDLWVIGGRSGQGKSWWLCSTITTCEKALPKEAGPLLVVTKEIPAQRIATRLDCVRFELSQTSFMKGELTKADKLRYFRGLEELEEVGSKIIILDDVSTLVELEAAIMMYAPSGVCVDGAYLLEPQMEEGMAKSAYLSRTLKQLGLRYQIPMVVTVQLRKKAGTKFLADSNQGQDDFYYGTWMQDADVGIRMFSTVEMRYYNQVGLSFVKGRELPPDSQLIWDFNPDEPLFGYSIPEDKISGEITEEEDINL